MDGTEKATGANRGNGEKLHASCFTHHVSALRSLLPPVESESAIGIRGHPRDAKIGGLGGTSYASPQLFGIAPVQGYQIIRVHPCPSVVEFPLRQGGRFGMTQPLIWTAPAERSGDGALGITRRVPWFNGGSESGVALRLPPQSKMPRQPPSAKNTDAPGLSR